MCRASGYPSTCERDGQPTGPLVDVASLDFPGEEIQEDPLGHRIVVGTGAEDMTTQIELRKLAGSEAWRYRNGKLAP